MLNENKVKMMTKMAIYEKNEGRKMLKTANYFKGDYITLGVLRTIISVTAAFVVGVILIALCKIDWLVKNINSLDYMAIGKVMIGYYVVLIIAFGVIAGILYARKYDSSRKEIKKFFARLNKLEHFYNVSKKKK